MRLHSAIANRFEQCHPLTVQTVPAPCSAWLTALLTDALQRLSHVPEELVCLLDSRLADAASAWPSIVLSHSVFVPYLANKISGQVAGVADVAAALRNVRIAELYLVCACIQRDAEAIAVFEREYFSEVDAVLRRFHSLPLSGEDVRQRMHERLFLRDPRSIATYAGYGELRGWLRAAALHLVLNITTREAREQPTQEAFFHALIDSDTDAEAVYLKQACGAELRLALSAAVDRLTARQKCLLRYAFSDGLTVDQIGAIFGVHRATAARWVSKAREQLMDDTKAELMGRLRVSDDDAASIVRAAISRIGTTLMRRLG